MLRMHMDGPKELLSLFSIVNASVGNIYAARETVFMPQKSDIIQTELRGAGLKASFCGLPALSRDTPALAVAVFK